MHPRGPAGCDFCALLHRQVGTLPEPSEAFREIHITPHKRCVFVPRKSCTFRTQAGWASLPAVACCPPCCYAVIYRGGIQNGAQRMRRARQEQIIICPQTVTDSPTHATGRNGCDGNDAGRKISPRVAHWCGGADAPVCRKYFRLWLRNGEIVCARD